MFKIGTWKIIAGTALFVLASACAKKQAAVAPPPPAPVAAAPARPTPPPPPARQQPPAPVARNNTPKYPDAATRARIDELIARIQDAYFDYDKHTLRTDAVSTLNSDSKELGEILKQYPTYKLRVEGFCDERGSSEYNMALGDARAKAAKEYLTSVGVPSNQLDTVSFGKEQQLCNDHDEACWQKNRRVHIVAEGNGG
jgi:peptidoglycan-associated lipoprotein